MIDMYIYIYITITYILENYNISLTWIKAILGWFPLIINHDSSEVAVRSL